MFVCSNIRAGMFAYSLALLLGVVLLQQFSILPSRFFLLASCVFLFLFVYFILKFLTRCGCSITRRCLALFYILILLIYSGLLIASFVANNALSQRLDENFIGKNIIINGIISSLPVSKGESQRFEFSVEEYRLFDDKSNITRQEKVTFPKKIRLSWYHGQEVNTDERWQFEVRLKPPHGFMNPGGFDYEAWLFQHGINATGYVRKSSVNQRLQEAKKWSVNRFRQSLALRIDQLTKASENSTFALVKALAIGDKSSISKSQWQVLTNTGTSHLMAISGLHIGLAALFANILARRLIPVSLLKYVPAQHVALVAGVIIGVLYALVAGFSIPTQRALIMLVVLTALLLLRRNHRPLDALGFALVVILLIDPLAVLSVGFWFSFSAVAVIFISVTRDERSDDEAKSNETNNVERSLFFKVKKVVNHWLRLQIIISLFLLPLSLFMFQQVSLVSPLANLFLIPYVSFFVVPVVLLGILFVFIVPVISDSLFGLAAVLLELVWPLLSALSRQEFALWEYADVDISSLLLTSLSLLLFYFSRKISRYCVSVWKIRSLASMVFLSCFSSLFINSTTTLNQAEIKLTVLDVGQGSSAVIQTQNHVLIFDAGAKFSEKLDTGSNIIIPFLHAKKINKVDMLIVSHGDADHIGGAQSLLDEYPEIELIGQDIAALKIGSKEQENKQLCFSGNEWEWDGVYFEFLSPERELNQNQRDQYNIVKKKSRNNNSCVLRVSSPLGSILLTGDIENEIEQQLLQKYGAQLSSDVLIVPHHGSNTSSSMDFITMVNPKLSIISAGYNNRYHLPSNKVLKRYRHHYADLKNRVLQTHSSGAISLTLKEDKTLAFQQFRKQSLKYWHHNVQN